MKSKIIHGDDYSESDILEIKNLLSSYDGGVNYSVDDWQNKPYTLLYVFLKTDRFHKRNGGLVLVYHQDELCAISGYNVSNFDQNVYILGARTFIKKDYQHQLIMSSYMIPVQIEQVRDRAKMVIFLFDVENKFNLYTIYTSGKLNQFLKNKLGHFNDLWQDLQACEFPISIFKNTIQNCLYIKLTKDFVFDWDSIRYIKDDSV